MKHLTFLLLLASYLIVACEKNPDTDKLDSNYLVYTSYDSSSVFSDFSTFYVIDSILLISDQSKATYWKNTNSAKIVEAYSNNFTQAGYTQAATSDAADIVFQLSYISSTYYLSYYNDGPWWNSYPGYWNWGGWNWYYPYSIGYSFSTGSIIGDLVNQKGKTAGSNKLTVIWSSYICGLLNGSSLSLSRTMNAINQAFDQSPYLKK